jgi:hypothetical protein
MRELRWIGIALAVSSASSFAAHAAAKKAAAAPEVVEAAAPVADGKGPRRRVIALDSRRAKAVYKVNAAPGLATVIELPEPWVTPPTCGDCVFGDAKPEAQLWRLDVSPQTRTLSIKPTRLPGADAPPSAFVTNIDVVLEGGLAVTLFVELAVPEEADARVELTLPDADKGQAKLSVRERELEAKFDERVTAAGDEKMLAAFLHGTTCKEFFGRPNRDENVVVRMKQMCRNGALLYVTFEVEDRRREDIVVTSAVLDGGKHEPSAGEKIEKERLRFNERALGVAAMGAPSPADPPQRYTLTVDAEGVDGPAKIVVDGLDF